MTLTIGLADGSPVGRCNLRTATFTQPEWSLTGAFTTPIALLHLLVDIEHEGPGISVTERDEPFTSFFVQGYGEEVEVVDDFVAFIQDISKEKPLAEALLERKIIEQGAAELLKKKWAFPLPAANSPVAGNLNGTGDDCNLVGVLEAMGLKSEEIMAGIEAAHLLPGMPIDEKIKSVLKNIGM